MRVAEIDRDAGGDSASPNPDGYLETILRDRSDQLAKWSVRCADISLQPGALATAVHVIATEDH
jgi:hypothetical protein